MANSTDKQNNAVNILQHADTLNPKTTMQLKKNHMERLQRSQTWAEFLFKRDKSYDAETSEKVILYAAET